MKYVIDGTKESAGYDHSKPWYLLGIVSFGTCGKGNPGIFTRWEIVIHRLTSDQLSYHVLSSRVESFIPWIQKTISD